jgi:NO-binding membrane sensor protein with MHYT domain
MKPELTRRIMGGVAAGSGLWWTCFVGFRLLIGNWPEDVEIYEVLFLSGLTLLMAIPGVIAWIFGVRLFQN